MFNSRNLSKALGKCEMRGGVKGMPRAAFLVAKWRTVTD